MKIVLSGYYGFDNVGDEAILYAIIRSLRSHHPTIEITVLSNQPEKTAATYHVKAINRWSVKDVFKAIRSSDALLSGGGSLLQDETGRKSIPYYTGIMIMAHMANKPVFIYAQGMGPFRYSVNQKLVRYAVGRAEMITVRDEQSKDLLQSIGIRNPITLVPDPVIGLEPGAGESLWLQQQGIQSKFVTVSVRDWPSNVNYLAKTAAALDQIKQAGYEIVFIPMHGEHDDETSSKVADLMKEDVRIAPFNATIEEKMAIIHSSSLLIGMRLHALIFAAVESVPFLALSYDPKVDSFASIVNQPVAGNVNEENWDGQSLAAAALIVLENNAEEKVRLTRAVSLLSERIDEATLTLLEKLK